ncbi:MAG: hypothetical protein NZ529_00190 [Cytophagaceae bacterium]|nr:hypothetical protein [Cytophagaceae bacterium]MDW8455183.1 hypothetical protein [Cytophagaceae bacterium]
MKKDIPFLPVEGVHIAVTRYMERSSTESWQVYIINKNVFPIENVFIRSKGYGYNRDGEKQETSVLRHHLPVLDAKSYAMIELIMPEVFHLNNEYWVSYFIAQQVYDKKFIFVPDSIIEANLSYIPEIKMQGVLHL